MNDGRRKAEIEKVSHRLLPAGTTSDSTNSAITSAMRRHSCPLLSMKRLLLGAAILAGASTGAFAQDNPTGDPTVQRIYDEGMRHSQAAKLAQVLMDSIGPRLTGSPANRAANEWLLRTYSAWGVPAKNEQYGTWRDWTRGPSGLMLVSPRVPVLEATMHACSAS